MIRFNGMLIEENCGLEMTNIVFERVVSYSSEDPKFPAQNLLTFGKKWKCKSPGEANVSVILQIEQPHHIESIDIGNEHSAFVSIFVGRAASDDYQMILPVYSFMTPEESNRSSNVNRVEMFKKCDLIQSVASEKWDRIKVVCSQPFNSRVQYGLSFLVVRRPEDKCENHKPPNLGRFKLKGIENDEPVTSLGRFHLKKKEDSDDVTVGSLFAKQKDKTNSEATNTNRTELQKKDRNDDYGRKEFLAIKIQNRTNPVKNPITENDDSSTLKKKMTAPTSDSEDTKPVKATVRQRLDPDRGKKQEKKRTQVKAKHPLPGNTNLSAAVSASKRPKPALKKPFNQLLEGVVFVLSGFVNPLRGSIRSKAVDMGAKYKQDWDASCTHLICAFKNTPKFQQVKGKGHIVQKDWIEQCHIRRARLPWRRFALDITDFKQPESEDEICEEVPDSNNCGSNRVSTEFTNEEIDTASGCKADSGSDTEEEIGRLQGSAVSAYMSDTEEEDDKRPDTSHLPMPPLP